MINYCNTLHKDVINKKNSLIEWYQNVQHQVQLQLSIRCRNTAKTHQKQHRKLTKNLIIQI